MSKVAKLEEKEISGQEFIIEEIQSLKASFSRLERRYAGERKYEAPSIETYQQDVCLLPVRNVRKVIEIENRLINEVDDVMKTDSYRRGPGHYHVVVDIPFVEDEKRDDVRAEIQACVENVISEQ